MRQPRTRASSTLSSIIARSSEDQLRDRSHLLGGARDDHRRHRRFLPHFEIVADLLTRPDERDVLRTFGGDIDRQIGTQRMRDRLERLAEPSATAQWQVIVLAVQLDRRLAREHLADDVDVLTRATEWLAVVVAVPTLRDLRT